MLVDMQRKLSLKTRARIGKILASGHAPGSLKVTAMRLLQDEMVDAPAPVVTLRQVDVSHLIGQTPPLVMGTIQDGRVTCRA